MSDDRARPRSAFAARDPSARLLVPLVWGHAARLEQVDPERLAVDADAATRALTTVARLYDVDAVTIRADGRLLADAVAATDHGGGTEPARPDAVASQPAIAVAVEVTRRLRRILGSSTGVVVAIPSPAQLAAQVGRPEDAGWAASILQATMRAFDADQPDAWFIDAGGLGPSGADGRVAALAEHFDVPLIDPEADAGVVRLGALDESAGVTVPSGTWLVTTRTEVPDDADPARVRAWLGTLTTKAGAAPGAG
jgi:hypothetical protein